MVEKILFVPPSSLVTKTEKMPQSSENGRGLVVSTASAVFDGSTATPRGRTNYYRQQGNWIQHNENELFC